MSVTSTHSRNQGTDDGLRRFNLRTQINRAWINAFAYPLVLLMMPTGFVQIGFIEATALALTSLSTSLVVYQIYRHRLDHYLPFNLNFVSFCLDAVLICAVIYFDGGLASMFFLFLLTNVAAATFLFRVRGMLSMMAINAAAYLGTLFFLGQLDGFGPQTMTAVGRLLFLYGAAFLPLRGIAELQDKNRFIRQLRIEEGMKVEALSRLTEELEGQSKELADANLQIQEANRLKSQFLASMSHELRTPLNSIIGFSSILKDNLGNEVEPRYLNFLGNILRSSEHLLSLINDLLDLSKIEAGRMEVSPERFPVGELLVGIREIMRGQTQQRHIEIELQLDDDLPLLNADPSKFKQIVFNLLSNAVKFSPEHSRVIVRASAVSRKDSDIGVPAIRVDVIDQGIGIAPHDQEVIFEEFRQAEDGFVRQYGGTGLGLTLVRRFLDIQGGTISVESELGVGSTFTVLIPQNVDPVSLRESPMDETDPTMRRPLDLRPKILIVEDDPIAYVNLSTILHSEGYATIRARTGDVVRSLVERERPVAIALDLVLPGLDGWEVLKELKSDSSTEHIPIIVVTMQENRELGIALGADDFFVKPVEPERFIRRVNELTVEKRPKAGKSVLIIDDDPGLQSLLEQRINEIGYRVIKAENGETGLHLARAEKPDVVVLDLMMPRLNGFEALDHLHHDPITSSIPVIVLTEKDLSVEERETLKDQIAALFPKHEKAREEFIETLQELLDRSSARLTGPGVE